jgi:hypothetical protein
MYTNKNVKEAMDKSNLRKIRHIVHAVISKCILVSAC